MGSFVQKAGLNHRGTENTELKTKAEKAEGKRQKAEGEHRGRQRENTEKGKREFVKDKTWDIDRGRNEVCFPLPSAFSVSSLCFSLCSLCPFAFCFCLLPFSAFVFNSVFSVPLWFNPAFLRKGLRR